MELNLDQIKELLPHREPFLFLDRVTSLEPGISSDAEKTLSKDEFFFRGHFPANPVTPGVLIIETMAQTAAVSVLALEENRGAHHLKASDSSLRDLMPAAMVTVSAGINPSSPVRIFFVQTPCLVNDTQPYCKGPSRFLFQVPICKFASNGYTVL